MVPTTMTVHAAKYYTSTWVSFYCYVKLLLLLLPHWMVYSGIMCWKSSKRGHACILWQRKKRNPHPTLGQYLFSHTLQQWHSTIGSLSQRTPDGHLCHLICGCCTQNFLPHRPQSESDRRQLALAFTASSTIEYVHCSGLMCTSALLEDHRGVTAVLCHNTCTHFRMYPSVWASAYVW